MGEAVEYNVGEETEEGGEGGGKYGKRKASKLGQHSGLKRVHEVFVKVQLYRMAY